jgi:hypothetical protein
MRTMRRPVIAVLLFLIPELLAAGDNGVWKKWKREAKRQCPANHIEWIADGQHDQLLSDFITTLPAATQAKVNSIADYPRRCSHEQIGFYCEMAVHLDAFKRLGLLGRFAAFACQHYKCAEPALCIKDRR